MDEIKEAVPGYYWVQRKKMPIEIAQLTKNGWKFFDGSHQKMNKQTRKILQRIPDYEESVI